MTKKKYYLFQLKSLDLNVVSILLLVLMFLITIALQIPFDISDRVFALTFAFMIPYFLLHEVLHSVSYVLNGAKFKNVTYGAHLEKGVLCCLCKQNITRRNILISLLFPFIFIGVITYIIGILINSPVLILLSIMNISGCSGDLMMFLALSKLNNYEYSEYDDPTSFGLYTSEDLSKVKMLGIKYVGTVDKLDRNDLKKIDINIGNAIFLAIIFVLGIVLLFI